jgi:DNA-directed RNA polymerase specialized sigma24 family protein
VREFLKAHGHLVLKHARTHCRVNGEKIPPEDVAREMELEVQQLAAERGIEADAIASPDGFLRAIALHACGRAKRRLKLVEQVAAGDDLTAVSEDLRALDGDLPEVSPEITETARIAQERLDSVKRQLAPRDALVFALLIEDDSNLDDVARTLSTPIDEVEAARERILRAAAAAGIATESEPGGAS